jgi:hypothetical protein
MPRAPILAALIASLAIALPGSAQGVAGVWDLTVETDQGARTSVYTFKQDGMAVTGSADLAEMGVHEIANGMLHGDEHTFLLELDFNGQAFDIEFSGKLAGEEIVGTVSMGQMGEAPWTGKKRAG